MQFKVLCVRRAESFLLFFLNMYEGFLLFFSKRQLYPFEIQFK